MIEKSWHAAMVFTCSPSSSRMLMNTSWRVLQDGVRGWEVRTCNDRIVETECTRTDQQIKATLASCQHLGNTLETWIQVRERLSSAKSTNHNLPPGCRELMPCTIHCREISACFCGWRLQLPGQLQTTAATTVQARFGSGLCCGCRLVALSSITSSITSSISSNLPGWSGTHRTGSSPR